MKILVIGDIIGKPGRNILEGKLTKLIESFKIDFVIANGENSAGGFGVTKEIASSLFSLGIDILTSGNHIWDKKETQEFISEEPRLIRPANYPYNNPGKGISISKTRSGFKVAVLNLSGRIFMDPLDCPFQTAEKELAKLDKNINIIIVDMHAEASSEKVAMGWFLDGKVSAVIGTHTHIQTADERVLPEGTAYITDIGMTGPRDSVIGVKKELALYRFITRMPRKFEVAEGVAQLEGVIIDINESSGKAKSIKRLQLAG